MIETLLTTGFLLPFEILLPILGVLLIRSVSPINTLIYRSFLGSIAALLYALVGAPDVALTEVMVGTLLSSLLYIVTIRSCYTVVILIDEHSPPELDISGTLKDIFDELNLRINFQAVQLSFNINQDIEFLDSSSMSGSPHAILHEKKLFVEVESLRNDILQTKSYSRSAQVIEVETLSSNSTPITPIH